MKHLKTYIQILEGKAEDKALKRIEKFFGVDSIAKKAVELSPKLSVWIINAFNEYVENILTGVDKKWLKENDLTPDDVRVYMKTGKTTKVLVKRYIIGYWRGDFSTSVQNILDWVNSFDISTEDKKNFTKMSFIEASNKEEEWHDSLKAGGVIENETGKVVMTFPDGFYWIDLQTTNCSDEANAMGHCGNTNKGDTLYSLRDRNKSPHVTASIEIKEGIVYQMKGRNNKKPIKKYHKYIVALLINDELGLKGFGTEYDHGEDFIPKDLDKDLYDELLAKRPEIETHAVFTDENIDEMFENMIYDMIRFGEGHHHIVVINLLYSCVGMKGVIECMYDEDDTLSNLFYKKYPDKNSDEIDVFDNKKLVDFYLGKDEKVQWSKLEELLEEDEEEVEEIFSLDDANKIIREKYTREEKEDEMEAFEWLEYTQLYDN